MSIGPYVRAWRISRGHSVAALALKAAVSESTLESIESEELDPTVSILRDWRPLSKSLFPGSMPIPATWSF